MPRNTLAAFDLKAARKVRGLSQVAVAKILCTTQPSIARWEAQGNMPEVFRKVWDLHWQIETIKVQMAEGSDVSLAKIGRKHGDLRSHKRKANLSNVSAGDKGNDSGSNKRARKFNARKRKTKSSAKGIEGSADRSTISTAEGTTEST